MITSMMPERIRGMAQLMSNRYSDLRFACKETEFSVHRVIVCTLSPVLKAACDGGFRVNSAKYASWNLARNGANKSRRQSHIQYISRNSILKPSTDGEIHIYAGI